MSVGVRITGSQFYDAATGNPFVPRGNNYVHADMFTPGKYDAAKCNGVLATMNQSHYNIVRVFVDATKAGAPNNAKAIDQAYAANFANFIRLAYRYGLRVIIGFDYWLPPGYQLTVPLVPNVENLNNMLLNRAWIAARNRYAADVLAAIKQTAYPALLDNIFSVDWNEPVLYSCYAPFTQTSGTMTMEDGVAVDMSSIAARQAMVDNWCSMAAGSWAVSIKHFFFNETATSEIYTPTDTGRNGYDGAWPWLNVDPKQPPRPLMLSYAGLDYLDIHDYPTGPNYNLAANMASAEIPLANKSKPLMMGEFGANKIASPLGPGFPLLADGAKALRKEQIASCSLGFQGWLTWTWDSTEQSQYLWTALDGSGAINNVMAPSARPNPCQ